jgi:putative ABC transport system permease protein
MTLFNLFRRRAHEREMTDEMRFHIDMEAADLERMGLPPDEARRRALAAFGGVQRFKEEGRESRGGAWLEDLVRDARYSLRSLVRSPGYTAVVVLTLSLGIAANTSIFSVANGILFKPLPYHQPERLLVIWDGLEMLNVPEAWVRAPEVVMLRNEAKSFDGFAVIRTRSTALTATDGGEPQQRPMSFVTANFFQLLGTGPDMGRGFTAGEDAFGAPPVAIISRRLWRQRFGADPAVIGKTIQIEGTATTIIGVLPQTFRYTALASLGSASGNADIYVPFTDTLTQMNPNTHSLGVLTRVRSDVPIPTALAELRELGARLNKDYYRERGFTFKAVPLQERLVREVKPALNVLLAAVGMLMLIMCSNLAVLALVRAAKREREITVRRAIGAGQARVTRQILTETVLLALAGGFGGIVLGNWALKGLLAMSPPGLPRREEIRIDLTVLAVTLGVALVVGLAMGLAPVVRSLRSDISTVLREKAPSHAGNRLRRGLVLAQLALSMVLLAGTGLLLSSFVRLTQVDAGFDPKGLATLEVVVTRGKYETGRPVVEAAARYAEALRAIPGVLSVGGSGAPPLSAGPDQSGFYVPGSVTNTGNMDHDRALIDFTAATPGYFKTFGIRIIEGEEFTVADNEARPAPRLIVIDELLAKRYWPKGNAVGQVALVDGDSTRVVGVARHTRMFDLKDVGREQAWASHAYQPYRYLMFGLRTNGRPEALAADIRRAIRSVDPEQAIMSVATMNDFVRESLAQRRLVLTLVGTFAGAALLLAALGVYGVTASAVSQRTRELGIRVALGADRRAVIWSVLSEPARLVVAGLVIGLAGTWAVRRVVGRMLFDVSATDPVTLAAVALVLLGVAVVASYLPARRATRVDPMVALRAE